MRRLIIATILLGAVGYGILGWIGDTEAPGYETAIVDRGPIAAMVVATGTVNPVTTVQVGTYVSGRIEEIAADFNTPVEQGQLLARIDPRPFQVKVEGARAALANARARVEKARADAALKAVTLRRTRELHAQGIVSEGDLDLAASEDRQARSQVTLDEAEVHSAQARLREAEVNLAYTDIVSPVHGVVVSRNVDVGQTVAATFQTPTLFLVAEDLTQMRVSASVSESDIGVVAIGQHVIFTVDAYPGVEFDGRVHQVRNAPVTVLNVVTYDVLVRVDNADLRLKPGMTANVTITTASRDDALRVPARALRFRPPAEPPVPAAAGARVWVLDGDGEPRPVTVSTGISDDRFTEITSGLDGGEQVAIALVRETAERRVLGSPFQARRRRRR